MLHRTNLLQDLNPFNNTTTIKYIALKLSQYFLFVKGYSRIGILVFSVCL